MPDVARIQPHALLGAALAALLTAPAAGAPRDPYDLECTVRIDPAAGEAVVALTLAAGSGVSSLRLALEAGRYTGFAGDGDVEVDGDHVTWAPPRDGGRLRYRHTIAHRRDDGGYDAFCTGDWALLRGDDLVPPARVRATQGARSRTRLRLALPDGWSAVTPYPRDADGAYRVDHPERRFDRPTGWVLVGKLDRLRQRVAGCELVIGSAREARGGARELQRVLAKTLPHLRDALGGLPARVTVVRAGDPLWLGGLSGPGSLFLHAERRFRDADGTSPVLHELIHVVMGAKSGRDGDWVVEGLAERYSLLLQRRAGLLSAREHAASLARLERRGRKAKRLRVSNAHGAITAQAVGVLEALDRELRQRGDCDLDAVLAALTAQDEPVTTAGFQALCERLSGLDLNAFFRDRVP